MKSLPRKIDAIRGLRAASWIRESTAGQYDNSGPDAQREQVARAIERHGLVDTGIQWTVAHSGWRIAAHPARSEMLSRAGVAFDVLVVGYASRFARSLEAHVDARRAFHAAGAAILFADERILSSDEDAWDAWAREVVEAESYSRRLSRRVREDYEMKRRRLGTPGGNRPPFGFRRDGRPPVLVVDQERMALVRRAYELSASGIRDREVAVRVGLKLMHIREVLTNPVYRGRLHRGEPANTGPAIDPALWDAVQLVRSRFGRRFPGHPTHPRRSYALGKLLFPDATALVPAGPSARPFLRVGGVRPHRAGCIDPRGGQCIHQSLGGRHAGRARRGRFLDPGSHPAGPRGSAGALSSRSGSLGARSRHGPARCRGRRGSRGSYTGRPTGRAGLPK
jgi:DNA invertase Pin-like site-specific DNA recombinase